MWRYYAESNICCVYMADVPGSEAGWGQLFAKSEWFARGWTLQELIAPVCVEFYAKNWEPIGTKFERHEQIAKITSIDQKVLVRSQAIELFSAAEKFSWAAHRKVTREGDETYSLLGLFDVNIPLLYGEGRRKAFARFQEAVYNITVDHSMFLFRHSLHGGGQPLLADSPTRFCERSDCTSCLSQGTRCLPSNFQYTNILASETWSTQAHEQITMTVTMSRNEVSTILPLLEYQVVSHGLKYLDGETPRYDVTHVAVLNYTLEKHLQGAFCLLLRRWPGIDSCSRLSAHPAILPLLGELSSQLQKTKLLICSGPTCLESNNRIDTTFSVKSNTFRVETWNAKGSISHSILSAQAGQNPGFEVQIAEPESSESSIQISCQIAGSQDPALMLSVDLIRRHETWSIMEIFQRKRGGKRPNLRRLFSSVNLADRCSVRLPHGDILEVKLRRLPGSARAGQEDGVLKVRYEISVDLLPGHL